MKNDMLNRRASSTSASSDWIRFLTFGFVLSVGIISIVGCSCDVDPNAGVDVVWEFDTQSRESPSSPAIGNDGTIYVGVRNNNLYAISPDGKLKWLYSTGDRIESSPAIGRDGTIYVGSYDNNLYAIDPDGSRKWLYPTGGNVASSPAIGSDGTIYVGSSDGNLYAINPENPDGPDTWIFATGGAVGSSPAIGCDGTLYVGSNDGNLYAINPGSLPKWHYTTGGGIYSSPAIGSDGIIYVGSGDHNLYAISSDGSLKWRYATDEVIHSSPAIGSDGTLYVGADDGKLYAINYDGSLKWRYATNEIILSSPAIGNDGTIYVGSEDLYAINPDGSLKQVYDLPLIESSPSIGSKGILYVSAESKLLAINVASDSLADTPWPMFRHDVKHTGRISDAGIPGNVNATAGDGQVVISWDPGSGVSSYNIYWSTSSGVTTSDSKISGATTPYSHTSLTNGTTYYYAITAENSCGESALSNEVSATPEIAGPYSVFISPGDGATGNICPDTTIFTANVTGGDSPYTYSWAVTTTTGAGFDIISPIDEQTFEVCPWDSMTVGTIEVTVTDSNSQVTLDNINVSAF